MTDIKHITMLVLLAISVTSCYKSFSPNLPDCDYNARIEFTYNIDDESDRDQLPARANVLDIYIFDKDGTLRYVEQLERESNNRTYVLKRTLASGKYVVVAWANVTDKNILTRAVVGETVLDDVVMSFYDSGTNGNGDKLYYGYRSFSVAEASMSKVGVDMVHHHLLFKFRVTWKDSPDESGTQYTAKMATIPSSVKFWPEYVYVDHGSCADFDALLYNGYSLVTLLPKQYITTVQNRNLIDHRIQLTRNVDGEVYGEFVTYRLRNEFHPIMSLYLQPTRSGGVQVMKEIDLKRYFDDQDIDLDRSLRQEYAVDIVIDGDDVHLKPLEVEMADWEEGEL